MNFLKTSNLNLLLEFRLNLIIHKPKHNLKVLKKKSPTFPVSSTSDKLQ